MAWILIVIFALGTSEHSPPVVSHQRYETREACETAKLNLAPWLNANARRVYITCTPAQ